MNDLDLKRRKWLRVRVVILGCILLGGASLVLRRAYELQIERGDTLREMAEEQYLKDVKLAPKRGTIYDRHGSALAVSVDMDSIYANPHDLHRAGMDPGRAAVLLSSVVPVDVQTLSTRLASDRYFVWVRRQVTPQEAEAVRKLQIPGVALVKEPRRYYPNKTLAAHILGFSNVDGKGIEGVELAYEEQLRGVAESVPAIRDRRGEVVFSEGLFDSRASLGDDVMLTIDKTIQHIAERELELGVRTFEAQAGSVIVMDPRTGEILAMANYPTFNPNFAGNEPSSHRRNRAVTDRYEPGSTIKPFTVAGALAAGTIRANQLIDCESGAMQVDEYTVHDTHSWQMLTPAQILAQSSNIGSAKTGATMGKQGLYQTLRGFGFGQKTGVNLPGETDGILRNYRRWYNMDATTIAFGQGMSVNTLQLATAMGALANGGRLMKPIIVARVSDARGAVLSEGVPELERRVVPAGTARLVSDMLTSVTSSDGTGAEAAIDGYLVAGKTGTAQKADYLGGGYAEGKWISSFVGFVPAEDPRLVIAVTIDEPMIAHYGATVAGPVFRRVGEQTLRHLGVPPRRAMRATLATVTAKGASKKAVAEEITAPLIAEGVLEPGQVRVPNFVHLSARSAMVLARRSSLELAVNGTGQVISQAPAAGTGTPRGARVNITLQAPTFDDDEAADAAAAMAPKKVAAASTGEALP